METVIPIKVMGRTSFFILNFFVKSFNRRVESLWVPHEDVGERVDDSLIPSVLANYPSIPSVSLCTLGRSRRFKEQRSKVGTQKFSQTE